MPPENEGDKQQDLNLGAEAAKAKEDELARANEQLKKLQAENEKLSKADKDRKDKDALARGEQEKLLAERTAELERVRKENELFQASMQERADSLFGKLPKEAQDKVSKYKEKLVLADWVSMIEDEMAGIKREPDTDEEPKDKMPAPNPGGKRKKDGKRELASKTYEIFENMGISEEWAEKLVTEKNPENPGEVRFTLPRRQFYDNMDVDTSKKKTLSREAYEQRKG